MYINTRQTSKRYETEIKQTSLKILDRYSIFTPFNLQLESYIQASLNLIEDSIYIMTLTAGKNEAVIAEQKESEEVFAESINNLCKRHLLLYI